MNDLYINGMETEFYYLTRRNRTELILILKNKYGRMFAVSAENDPFSLLCNLFPDIVLSDAQKEIITHKW